jgi:hypothetical protein
MEEAHATALQMAHQPGRRLPRASEDALVAAAREASRLATPMSSRFPRLLWGSDSRHRPRRAAQREPRGRRLVDRVWQPSSFGFAACVSPWRGALGSAPTDFCGILVVGTSLVSDRVRIRRRSRRPRPVARHGLDHKPPYERVRLIVGAMRFEAWGGGFLGAVRCGRGLTKAYAGASAATEAELAPEQASRRCGRAGRGLTRV